MITFPSIPKGARLQIEKIKHATEIIKTQPEVGKVLEKVETPSIRELVEEINE